MSDISKDISRASGSALRIIATLKWMRDEQGGGPVLVTATGLAKRSKGLISRPSAGKALKELEEIGAIEIVKREGHARMVRVVAT